MEPRFWRSGDVSQYVYQCALTRACKGALLVESPSCHARTTNPTLLCITVPRDVCCCMAGALSEFLTCAVRR